MPSTSAKRLPTAGAPPPGAGSTGHELPGSPGMVDSPGLRVIGDENVVPTNGNPTYAPIRRGAAIEFWLNCRKGSSSRLNRRG